MSNLLLSGKGERGSGTVDGWMKDRDTQTNEIHGVHVF